MSPSPERRPRGRPREDKFQKDSDAKINQSLEKGLNLLKVLSHHDGLTLTALADKAGLPVSSTHRLLATFAAHELVACDDLTQKWSIGIEALRIGMAFQRRNKILVAARPLMTELMEATGETVNMAMLDGYEIVFVSQVECQEPIRAFFRIGERRAIHASGIGKALLAEMAASRIDIFLNSHALTRFTAATITEPRDLRENLARIRERGWSIDDEEANPGMRCVAAAVFNEFGEARAGISLSGPSTRLTADRLSELGLKVRETADRLSKLTGGHLLA
ncbi:Transcriptional repressor IclR (plasmid) [Asticcacaulis sp. MM231]|uniref:IclR family transcriptional regulator n=1 Tax=Asticcacaulis sp. MM231 TaxID=3157666 RepID=UPI0032D5A147